MKQIQIAENTWKIGSNLGNEELFEGIWPTPDGVSVNSYFIREEKSVLIDIVKKDSGFIDEYEEELNAVGASLKTIDYLIVNPLQSGGQDILHKKIRSDAQSVLRNRKKRDRRFRRRNFGFRQRTGFNLSGNA